MADAAVSMDEFYCAVGRATTSWGMLEDGLRDVFSRLIICSIAGTMIVRNAKASLVVGNVFYSSTNLRARLAMITETMDLLIEDADLLAEWNAVKNRILELYKRRNLLAHGVVYGSDNVAAYVTGPGLAFSRRRMNFVQVCASDQSFKKQTERLTQLAIAINQHMVARAKGGS